MKIGIFCRQNDNNIVDLIERLFDIGENNIFVIIENKNNIKRSKIKEWKSENFDLSFFEKIISLLNSVKKRIIQKRINKKINKRIKGNFDAKFWCVKNNIKHIFSPHNSIESENFIKNEQIEHLFLLSGGIIKKNILDLNNLIIYNAHPGKLPRHRGLGSMEWSIIEGRDFSLTLHILNHKIDEGDIIKIVDFFPNKNENIKDFKDRVINYKSLIFSEHVKNINKDGVVRYPQNSFEGILHRKLTRKEKKVLEKQFNNLKKI